MKEFRPPSWSKQFDRFALGLSSAGYAIAPQFLDAATALALAAEAQAHWQSGVGRDAGWARRPDLRSDEVFWVDGEHLSPTLATTLGTLDALKQHLNRSLFARLEDFEVHLARYGRGAFNPRHTDQFEGSTRQASSLVLYLNHQRRPQDGGALRLRTTPPPGRAPLNPNSPFIQVWPETGTLVVLRSAGFWHEVRRTRLSLTEWFLRRASNPLQQVF